MYRLQEGIEDASDPSNKESLSVIGSHLVDKAHLSRAIDPYFNTEITIKSKSKQ